MTIDREPDKDALDKLIEYGGISITFSDLLSNNPWKLGLSKPEADALPPPVWEIVDFYDMRRLLGEILMSKKMCRKLFSLRNGSSRAILELLDLVSTYSLLYSD